MWSVWVVFVGFENGRDIDVYVMNEEFKWLINGYVNGYVVGFFILGVIREDVVVWGFNFNGVIIIFLVVEKIVIE